MVVSALTRTTSGFLVARSVTLISLAAGSTEMTVAARLRNVPETIASGFHARTVGVLFAQHAHAVARFQFLERTRLGVVETHRIGRITPEIGRVVRLDDDRLGALHGVYGHGESAWVSGAIAVIDAGNAARLPLGAIVLLLLADIRLRHDDDRGGGQRLSVFREFPQRQTPDPRSPRSERAILLAFLRSVSPGVTRR